MTQRNGFTLVEAAVVLFIIGILIVLFMPRPSRHREPADRTVCGTRLRGLYKALLIYSVGNNDKFPTVGMPIPAASAAGFREGNRATGQGAILDNNITATLWTIVRDGSVLPRNFICMSTYDEGDPLTISLTNSNTADLDKTYDFLERKNLSYSFMNMYDPMVSKHWSPNADADWVFAADNNANDAPDRHTLSKGAKEEDINVLENSPNHAHQGKYEGQNIMFGDGHVEFQNDPFVGPGGDNIYAASVTGQNQPPTVASKAESETDVILIPLSGNGGGAGSLSGLAMDVKLRLRRGYGHRLGLGEIAVLVGIGVIVLFVIRMVRWEFSEPPEV